MGVPRYPGCRSIAQPLVLGSNGTECLGNPWEIHGKSVGNPWEIPERYGGFLMTFHGKVININFVNIWTSLQIVNEAKVAFFMGKMMINHGF